MSWNSEITPDWLPKVGEYYVAHGARQAIVRVTQVGREDYGSPLPDCISYEVIGTRDTGGKHWVEEA